MVSAVWSDAEVAAAFDVDTAIASQRAAFESLGRGEAQLADKVVLPNPAGSDVTLCYASRLSPDHGAVSKLVAVHPDNLGRNLPAVSATVLVLDGRTGHLVATMEASTLTGIRTAAGSAVAADALSVADADIAAVLGSGVQARAHVRALARVRPVRDVRIFSPDAGRRASAAEELSQELGLRVRPVDSPESAVRDAAIVATCTLSSEPVVATDALAAGTTVLSVGSFEPHRREVDEELLRRAGAVVVDDVRTARVHAGPIVHAVRCGDLAEERLRSLGDVLVGRVSGRRDQDEIIFYNSVGLGVQDAAAAHAVLGSL